MTAPPFSAIDHTHMARALQLAERGAFTTKPNPLVGCVLAHGDEIVGAGWHERAGEAHAEIHALRAAGQRAQGATAYVTLEPCAHLGRTGPCADALIEAGVAQVVAALRDPFPSVAGKGLDRLRDAGIRVRTGLLETQARELNRGFLSRIERGRPWVRLKLAMSLDGRTALADGRSQWITGEAARADAHRWRARAGAILTGAGTVLADDPRLTVRLQDGAPFVAPLRVVLDSRLQSLTRRQVREGDAPTLYLHAPGRAPPPGERHAEFQAVPSIDGRMDLHAVLALLAERGVNEVQVEAGATLAGALLAAGLADEVLLYVAPVLLGDAARPLFAGLGIEAMAQKLRLKPIQTCWIGDDLRLSLRPD